MRMPNEPLQEGIQGSCPFPIGRLTGVDASGGAVTPEHPGFVQSLTFLQGLGESLQPGTVQRERPHGLGLIFVDDVQDVGLERALAMLEYGGQVCKVPLARSRPKIVFQY
jgi:hypothetical protein